MKGNSRWIAGLVVLFLLLVIGGCSSKNDKQDNLGPGDQGQIAALDPQNIAQSQGPISLTDEQLLDLFGQDENSDFTYGPWPQAHLVEKGAQAFDALKAINKAPIDISHHMQKRVDQLASGSNATTQVGALIDQLSKPLKSGASGSGGTDSDAAPYIRQLDDNTSLVIGETTFLKPLTEDVVAEAYLSASLAFEELLSTERMVPVTIMVGYYDASMESFSIYRDGQFFIHLNGIIGSKLLTGSVYHELFHAYQYDLGYRRSTLYGEWMMEAQAIWAVVFGDESLDYHDRYSAAIYDNPTFAPQLMNPFIYPSWYQFFYFLYDEKGGAENTVYLIKNGHKFDTLYDLILSDQKKVYRVQNMLAEFTRYLFEMQGDGNLTFKENSPMAMRTLSPLVLPPTTHEELSSNTTEDWSEQMLNDPGISGVLVPGGAGGDAVLSVLVQLVDKETPSGLQGAMLLYGFKDGKWTCLLDGRYDSFIATVDYKKMGYGDLALLWVNYGTGLNKVVYRWDLEQKVRADGNISIHITTSQDKLGSSYEKTESIIINEDIERFKDASDISGLIVGNTYEIKKLQVDYMAQTTERNVSASDGSKEDRQIAASGTYTYDAAADQLTFENPLLQLPDFNQMLGGLGGGLDQILGDANKELQQASQDLQQATGDLNAGGLGFPMNSLIRLKDNLAIGTFNLYPTMPSNITGKPWVHQTTVVTKTQDDGGSYVATATADLPFTADLLPVWFTNPNFNSQDQERALKGLTMNQDALMAGVKNGQAVGTDDIMKELAVVNGAFDITNMSAMLNQGPFEMDLKVGGALPSRQTQWLTFDGKVLKGHIETAYIDANGANVVIVLDLDYNWGNQ